MSSLLIVLCNTGVFQAFLQLFSPYLPTIEGIVLTGVFKVRVFHNVVFESVRKLVHPLP